jgi:hypothetical protein
MKMKSLTSAVAGILIVAFGASAQQSSTLQDGQTIPLWSAGKPPGALGSEEADIPAITIFLPRTMAPATPAIIVCPGGSYARLAATRSGAVVYRSPHMKLIPPVASSNVGVEW